MNRINEEVKRRKKKDKEEKKRKNEKITIEKEQRKIIE